MTSDGKLVTSEQTTNDLLVLKPIIGQIMARKTKELQILKGTETFAKEPNFAKLLRDARAVSLKKSTGLSRMSVTASFFCFGCFAVGQHVTGCFFLTKMYISMGLHRSMKNIIDLLLSS